MKRSKDVSARPLEGIRVIEIATGLSGPVTGGYLAHHGAQGIRLETKKAPDGVRMYIPPWGRHLGTQPDLSPGHHERHTGKTFGSLDLSNPRALELLRGLAAKSDVMLINYSAGAMDKLGLKYETFRAVNPSLIYLTILGFGNSGPYRDYTAWGSHIEGYSGLLHVTRRPHEPPGQGFVLPDFLSVFHGLVAIMAALEHRERTGQGQAIDISMMELGACALGPEVLEQTVNHHTAAPLGNRSRTCAPQGCYPCRGDPSTGSGQADRWGVISVTRQEEWQALCAVIGQPQLASDPRFATVTDRLRHHDALDELIAEWTRTKTAHEAMYELHRAGVPAGVVQNAEDLYFRDVHLAARRFYQWFDHDKKRQKVLANGLAFNICEPSAWGKRTGISVGQDNELVYKQVLGLSEQEYQDYLKAGAIEPTPQWKPAPEESMKLRVEKE